MGAEPAEGMVGQTLGLCRASTACCNGSPTSRFRWMPEIFASWTGKSSTCSCACLNGIDLSGASAQLGPDSNRSACRMRRQGAMPGRQVPLRKLIYLALDGLVSFRVPLRIITLLGFTVSLLSFLVALFYLIKKLTIGVRVARFRRWSSRFFLPRGDSTRDDPASSGIHRTHIR